MDAENWSSFDRKIFELIQNEDLFGTTSPQKESPMPILKFFDPDESPNILSGKKPFPIQKNIVKPKEIEKSIVKCKCLKSKCQKSYCECFAVGRSCSVECNCLGCNNSNCSQKIKKTQCGGCNCKKTGCVKKYCECYLKKQRCTFLCNCIDCCNQEDSESEKEKEKENEKNHCIGILSSNLLMNSQITEQLNK
ncbi:unnamed protein product [Paramecium octaurelia]|uniref:CRC domain-containing protein n=1 Tax=Paramecium octaurelia TaxID=43137 RepID=A0A8S1UY23_PAROT|nr:unnamed protein product [Paramecium octaurelia]